MNPKQSWEEFLEWGLKNEENRKRAMAAGLKMLAILYRSPDEKISSEELNKVADSFDELEFKL
ncbi:MAG: hypothetical protein K1060chlam5_00076 [Candidatus Anoxychlamydiales bacterium]|nr:hypothetical protein [Candidatus Anoxychlamydiales bacterium]